jgi:hypothetical protein
MLTPFLEEIGISLRFFDDQIDCSCGDFHTFVLGRSQDCFARVGWTQRSDFQEIEEPFRIRLGITHSRSQLWQTCSDDCERKLLLRTSVERRDKRRHLFFLDILEFIDEGHDCCLGGSGSDANLLEQCREIALEFAIVSQARLGIVVESNLDVRVGYLELGRESGQSSKAANSIISGGFFLAQVKQDEPK